MSEMPDQIQRRPYRSVTAQRRREGERLCANSESTIPTIFATRYSRRPPPRWPDSCSANCSNWHGTSRLATKPYYRTAPPTNAGNWRQPRIRRSFRWFRCTGIAADHGSQALVNRRHLTASTRNPLKLRLERGALVGEIACAITRIG